MSKLTFTAYVYPEDSPTSPLVAIPNKLRLEVGDDDRKHSVRFKNISLDTLQLELVWADEEYLSVEVPGTSVGPGESMEVLVGINVDRHQTKFESSFTVETSDEKNTRLSIPVLFGKSDAPSARVTNK